MSDTKIKWTNKVWNPVTGCTKVSAGCRECYAEHIHNFRHKAFNEGKNLPLQYRVPFKTVVQHYDRLKLPYHWKKPQMIFVNSMSDLFHKDVSFEFIERVFVTMQENPQHIFQILTKRPERMREFIKNATFCGNGATKNVWLGVSVEDQKSYFERGLILKTIPAAIKWLSIEPLLDPVMLNCDFELKDKTVAKLRASDWNWVVVGAESGKNKRPCLNGWIDDIVKDCKSIYDYSYDPWRKMFVPVFVKQIHSSRTNNVEKDINKFPLPLQYQEYPEVNNG